ncbi:MAG: hypothetical protein AAF580_13945 [Pseudomonadota bacterium]
MFRNLVVGVLAVAVLAVAPLLETPKSQLDIFGYRDGSLALPAMDGEAIHRSLVAALEPDRVADALAPRWGPMAARAASGDGEMVRRVVQVDTIAHDHVRIRVAAKDPAVAAHIADEIVRGVRAANTRERLLIRSETTGGRLVLLLQAAAVVALLWCVASAGWRGVRSLSRLRLPEAVASR